MTIRGASRGRPARHGVRRIERWSVGLVMAVLAFALEKAVLRSIRRGRVTPIPTEPTAISASGAAIRAD